MFFVLFCCFFSINMKSEKWRFGIQTQYYSFCRHINANAFWVFLLLTRISVRAINWHERYFWQTTLCDHINVKVYFESCWMCGTNIIWRKQNKKSNILAMTKYMKINFVCYCYCLLNIIIHEIIFFLLSSREKMLWVTSCDWLIFFSSKW